jgi:basic membrane protein A and related proteins
MKRKSFIAIAAILALALVFVGCQKKAAPAAAAAAPSLAVAMVTDVGGINDQSFNQSAWEGLQKAGTDLTIKVSYKESKQNADYAPNLETLLDAKNDLIWGIGYMMADAIKDAATKNPKQTYAIIDQDYGKDTPANVVGVTFKAEQSSFLVGYIAGKTTKTGKVGFVGGMTGPLIAAFQFGYEAGVRQANPKVKILSQYAESFSDAAKGKAIATQMYQSGADIVYHAAGAVGNGVIEAAKEKNKFAIGVDRDQNYLAPDNVLTSAMKRVDNGVYNVVKQLKDGTLKGGTTISYGLAEGGVDIAPTSSKLVAADVLTQVAALKQAVIDGKIVVPFDEAGYKAYKPVDITK